MRSIRLPNTASFGSRIRNRTAAILTKLPNTYQPLEEETIPEYSTQHFCQISPGDVVGDGRYSIIAKLGWGRFSTVWLARDLHRWRWQSQRYVSIKFNNCDVDQESIEKERTLLQRLSKADSNHRGFYIVRRHIDSFELKKTDGTHQCLVYEPLRETLDIYRRRFPGGRLPIPLLRVYAQVLLIGVDFLHAKCGIIHTDLKLDNILVGFEDESILDHGAQQLQRSEFFFKESPNGRIFQSCDGFGPLKSYISVPIIADFGLAESVDIGAYPIQPDAYRAPEVLLGWGWSSSTDIWNLGNLIWTLASGKDLFTSLYSEHRRYDAVEHLAQMIAVLGAPPPALIKQRSRAGWRWSPAIENQNGEPCEDACSFFGGPFFDPASAKFLHAIPPSQSLHDMACFVSDEERPAFVDFMSKMLMWDPTERLKACDLADHPWLRVVGP